MKIKCKTLAPRWDGPVIVAATGESLTEAVAATCAESGRPIIAVKQAVIRLPDANAMYANNDHTWRHYAGFPNFQGERWSTHGGITDNKIPIAEEYPIRLVRGQEGDTFSSDPIVVHYGNNSGFQAIGLAIHWMRKPGTIILVGFDMHGGYFFGEHPHGKRRDCFPYISVFETAARSLPEGVDIVNANPSSALECFQQMSLEDALASLSPSTE